MTYTNCPQYSECNFHKFRAVFESVPGHALLLVGRNNKIQMAGAAVQEIYGYSSEELIGHDISQLYSEGLGCPDFSMIERLKKVECESTQVRKDRSIFVADVSMAVLNTEADGGYVFVSKDATERVTIQAENLRLLDREKNARVLLESLYLGAQKADKLKDEFLSTLSHELRTPLGVVLGWVELLRRGKVSPANQAQCIERIYQSAKAQLRIVNDVLEMSRVISNKVVLKLETVNVKKLLQEIVETLQPAASVKSINLTVLAHSFETVGLFDEQRLRQVISNLISNAIKFSHRGGQVVVEASEVATDSSNGLGHKSDRELQIAVLDEGEGIDPEFLPELFEKFSQEDPSTVRRFGGLGLGLALVKSFVNLHGGVVSVQSGGKGKGCQFAIRLPIRTESAGATEVHAPRLSTGDEEIFSDWRGLAGSTVMIVDDDESSLEIAQEFIRDKVSVIVPFKTGMDALDYLRSHEVNLIICDIGMEKMDGNLFLREFRKLEAVRQRKRTPAVALTAYSDEIERVRALNSGFDDLVVKPTSSIKLLNTLVAVAAAQP